jgi:hypothetical protein
VSRLLSTIALLCSALVPFVHVSAQTLSGRVRHPDGLPAEAVQLVALSDADGRVLARTLSGRRGEFRLPAPEPRVRLRALRIGYQPAELGTFDTGDPTSSQLELTLPLDPARLPAVSTVARQRCANIGAASADLVALFGDVRLALAAIRLGASQDDAPTTRAVLREQLTDLRGRAASPARYRRLAGRATRPFQSLGVDSLRLVGYVSQERDGVVYRAPDSDLLASDAFLTDHCLQFVPQHPDESMWVGIGFEPIDRVRDRVAIRGTFWVDRATRAVRRLEFTYVGLPRELDRHQLGGTVDFGELPDGTWFEAAWMLRMAKTFIHLRSGQVRVEALQSIGGRVVDMRRGSGLLYLGDADLADMLALVEQAGGDGWEETELAEPEGVRLCSDTEGETSAGVFGIVYDGGRTRLADVSVSARWQTEKRLVAGEWRWTDESLDTRTDADGFFRLCGLPAAQAVEIELTTADGQTHLMAVQTPSAGRDVRMELTAGR